MSCLLLKYFLPASIILVLLIMFCNAKFVFNPVYCSSVEHWLMVFLLVLKFTVLVKDMILMLGTVKKACSCI